MVNPFLILHTVTIFSLFSAEKVNVLNSFKEFQYYKNNFFGNFSLENQRFSNVYQVGNVKISFSEGQNLKVIGNTKIKCSKITQCYIIGNSTFKKNTIDDAVMIGCFSDRGSNIKKAMITSSNITLNDSTITQAILSCDDGTIIINGKSIIGELTIIFDKKKPKLKIADTSIVKTIQYKKQSKKLGSRP